jgi:hypothetical protein
MPKTIVWQVIGRRVRMKPYKYIKFKPKIALNVKAFVKPCKLKWIMMKVCLDLEEETSVTK